jgi:ATP-binding cassette subfamily C protein
MQSILMLVLMLMAALAEGFGLSAMLPLLSTAIGSHSGSETAANTTAERIVTKCLDSIGLPASLEILLVIIFLAIILKSLLLLLAKKKIGFIVAQVATDLRLDLLRALLASRWEFHLKQPVGSLANTMISEAGRTSKAYLSGATMIIALIQALILVAVALMVSWQATLAALLAGAAIFFILRKLIEKARRAGQRQTKVLKSLVGQLVDSLQSIKPIKAMALEHLAGVVLTAETNKLNKALRKEVISKEYLRACSEPLRYGFLLLGLYAALVYLDIPAATVIVFVLLIGRILQQLGKVQDEYQKMVTFESAYDSLTEKISEANEDRELSPGTKSPTLNNAIRLDNVSFGYGEKQVLENVLLKFPARLITAIIGPSGSGKTTIADLTVGLLEASRGAIWIDDLQLNQVDLKKWRAMIGYVPQESWLLHDSVYNNVTLGDSTLSEGDVVKALKNAGAWQFVQGLPDGLRSSVGERGGKLSGGQRQRIAIARALVHRPSLLILDEATSALDPETAAAICRTLDALKQEHTIIAISHQTSILEVADQAYRIEEGRVLPVEKME